MTRPTSTDDLDDYEKRGDLIISWGTGLSKVPSADALIVAARAALIGLYGDRLHWAGDSIYAPPEPGVLEQRLKAKQDQWDRGHEAYQRLMETREIPEPRWALDSWLSREGKPKADEILEQLEAVETQRMKVSLQRSLDRDDDRANPGWDAGPYPRDLVEAPEPAQPSQYAEENVAGTVADLDREDALPDDGKHRSFDDVAEAGDDLRDSEIPAAISAELDQAMAQARDAEANGRALLPKLDSVKEGTIPDF
jgi:hypothetical protein